MSSLYKNVIQYDWNLDQGEFVAFIRYPFQELYLDPVFKVLDLDLKNSTADIEVVKSSFLAVGTVYRKQPLIGLRRVKLTTIGDSLRYEENPYANVPTVQNAILSEGNDMLMTEDGNYLTY